MVSTLRRMVAAFLLGYVTSYIHWRALVIRDALREDDKRARNWRLNSDYSEYFDDPI